MHTTHGTVIPDTYILADRVTSEVALELGETPPVPAEQAQLPSEPAPPYTAIFQSSPKIGEVPYSSRDPSIMMTLPGSVSALPITVPPTSSVESSFNTVLHLRTVAEGALPSTLLASSGGPPAL